MSEDPFKDKKIHYNIPVYFKYNAIDTFTYQKVRVNDLECASDYGASPPIGYETDLGREKGDGERRCVCSQNINKAWEPVDLFLSFLHSKEKCS